MSASTEELLIQILFLENEIKETKENGLDTTHLEKKLHDLQELFHSMNESLTRKGSVLKG